MRYMPETFGPGCAFLDYDNDGWMDIYLVNSGPCDFWKPSKPVRNALYRNNRDGTFTDITTTAGVAGGTFGMGVAVGDYNNDGYPDLFVTSYGRTILYRNNGDGTFADVTDRVGLRIEGWTTSAVWFDYDGDGKLDLFVCSYIEYGKEDRRTCVNNELHRNYFCDPRLFRPTRSFLFHNNGDETFTEVGRSTEIGLSLGKGLGVVATDINNDGLADLFVANDTTPNHLFVNRGSGKWEEISIAAEVGFSDSGQARSGMGVDAADIDGDGWEDLFVANIDGEMFSVYRNTRDEHFEDIAHSQGVAEITRFMSGWGLKYFDYDNDGAVDLMVANGHPDDVVDLYKRGVRYREPLLLFHRENGRYRSVGVEAGAAFRRNYAARGLAVGDFNNDGRLDVLIGINGGSPLLLKNNSAPENNWIGLRLHGVAANRDGIGARITWSAGGITRSRLKTGGGSYLSSHDPREVLGLGKAKKCDWVEILWPGFRRRTERFKGLATGAYQTIIESV
ncbi:MAG: CRTAC1 family protein [Acidobacteriota bacterium]|nr:CRTAC1 family protein [Acidobacteriota bacterium]